MAWCGSMACDSKCSIRTQRRVCQAAASFRYSKITRGRFGSGRKRACWFVTPMADSRHAHRPVNTERMDTVGEVGKGKEALGIFQPAGNLIRFETDQWPW